MPFFLFYKYSPTNLRMKNVITLFKQKKYKNEGNSNKRFEFSSILISQKKIYKHIQIRIHS